MIKAVNEHKKDIKLMTIDPKYFYEYGSKIIEFIEFLTLVPQFRHTPHFILNWNSAHKIKYCIYSIHKLEKFYMLGKRSPSGLLFNEHEKYKMNIEQLNLKFNWSMKDDFILLSSVLDHGFNNYRRISNALRWVITCPKIVEFATEKGFPTEPHRVLKEMNYKMAWECLYERVFSFDIVKARKFEIPRHEVKSEMMRLKKELETFMKHRIELIIDLGTYIESIDQREISHAGTSTQQGIQGLSTDDH